MRHECGAIRLEQGESSAGQRWITAEAEETRAVRQSPAFVGEANDGGRSHQKSVVGIVLLHTAWKTKRTTFPLPNGQLAKLGVSRLTKYRALADLERAGLIAVERLPRKTPSVTMLGQ